MSDDLEDFFDEISDDFLNDLTTVPDFQVRGGNRISGATSGNEYLLNAWSFLVDNSDWAISTARSNRKLSCTSLFLDKHHKTNNPTTED